MKLHQSGQSFRLGFAKANAERRGCPVAVSHLMAGDGDILCRQSLVLAVGNGLTQSSPDPLPHESPEGSRCPRTRLKLREMPRSRDDAPSAKLGDLSIRH